MRGVCVSVCACKGESERERTCARAQPHQHFLTFATSPSLPCEHGRDDAYIKLYVHALSRARTGRVSHAAMKSQRFVCELSHPGLTS